MYSIESEKTVLGCILRDSGKHFDEVAEILKEQNFYLEAHKIIYKSMLELAKKKSPIDIVTVENFLKTNNLLNRTGGFAYLAELANDSLSLSNISSYAEIVLQKFKFRTLSQIGNQISTEAKKLKDQDTLDQLLEATEKSLTELSLNSYTDNNVNLNESLDSWVDDLQQRFNSQQAINGVPSGIDNLDKLTAGYQDGDLVILAARPSMGKTAFSLNIAKTAIEAKPDQPVFYFSMEMPVKQLLTRFVSMLSNVEMTKLKEAINLTEADFAFLTNALSKLNDWKDKLILNEESYLTPALLKNRVRRNCRKYGKPSLIIVDYLQLMSEPSIKNNRNLEISAISASLKQLAKEINCPVIALSQLNRQLEQRQNKRPIASDLRDSGGLEQDADLILFLYRDEVYNPEAETGRTEIIISKHRNGELGVVPCYFNGSLSKFSNY